MMDRINIPETPRPRNASTHTEFPRRRPTLERDLDVNGNFSTVVFQQRRSWDISVGSMLLCEPRSVAWKVTICCASHWAIQVLILTLVLEQYS